MLYLLVFAVAAMIGKPDKCTEATRYNRFLILIPAYREDVVIESTVRSFLRQTYPSSQYDVIVIADHCQPDIQGFRERLPSRWIQRLLKHYNP